MQQHTAMLWLIQTVSYNKKKKTKKWKLKVNFKIC